MNSKLHHFTKVEIISDEEDDSDSPTTSSETKQQKQTAPRGDYKMVLVVRNDLKMGKGKIGAQCGHASVGAYEKAMKTNRAIVQRWENSGCAKICLKVDSERELMNFRKGASVRGLNYYLVHDAGRTQVRIRASVDSKTCLMMCYFHFRLLLEAPPF